MIELFILVVIVAVVVLSLRSRKPVLEAPLIIERPGRYHITLAPQLRDVQPFIENIAGHFAAAPNSRGDTPTLYYQVHQAKLSREQGGYLLAVALRSGVLYFQAINPASLQLDEADRLERLREYSAAVLVYHPLTNPADEEALERLRRAVSEAASQVRLEIRELR